MNTDSFIPGDSFEANFGTAIAVSHGVKFIIQGYVPERQKITKENRNEI
jgi:hypothetical protein